jgi:hypothetical protein
MLEHDVDDDSVSDVNEPAGPHATATAGGGDGGLPGCGSGPAEGEVPGTTAHAHAVPASLAAAPTTTLLEDDDIKNLHEVVLL